MPHSLHGAFWSPHNAAKWIVRNPAQSHRSFIRISEVGLWAHTARHPELEIAIWVLLPSHCASISARIPHLCMSAPESYNCIFTISAIRFKVDSTSSLSASTLSLGSLIVRSILPAVVLDFAFATSFFIYRCSSMNRFLAVLLSSLLFGIDWEPACAFTDWATPANYCSFSRDYLTHYQEPSLFGIQWTARLNCSQPTNPIFFFYLPSAWSLTHHSLFSD